MSMLFLQESVLHGAFPARQARCFCSSSIVFLCFSVRRGEIARLIGHFWFEHGISPFADRSGAGFDAPEHAELKLQQLALVFAQISHDIPMSEPVWALLSGLFST